MHPLFSCGGAILTKTVGGEGEWGSSFWNRLGGVALHSAGCVVGVADFLHVGTSDSYVV